MYCTKCGNKINSEDKFCTKCGMTTTNLNNNTLNKDSKDSDVSGLIFGIISLFMFWFPIVGIPCAIIGIVNGKKYKNNTGKNSGSIVMGIIGIVLSIIFVIIVSLFIYLAFNYVDSKDSSFQEVIDKYFDDDYYDFDEEESFDIRGYSWRGNDSSMLYLNSDKSYILYLDDNVHDNNFYTGTYEVYVGRKAVNYIANDLREYGITYEEQMRLFNSGEYDIEDYYLIILNCTDVYLDGKVDENIRGVIPYYGFYDDDSKYLSLINMKTSNSAGFTLNAKISSTDDNTL